MLGESRIPVIFTKARHDLIQYILRSEDNGLPVGLTYLQPLTGHEQ